MKSTGIVRKVDSLGRVVLPIELRNSLNINQADALEIFTEGDRIILRKYEPYCVFCGEVDDVINFNSKNVCKKCAGELSQKIY
ncbi:MAG: AbrB/MazE/SpoVT family DNA-binding domain-containing protein [Clostridia bacterium]|nr:AbrB/MazE/SpoVT family DNA-binding domain-containing protein [Clostridia bacterium]